MAETTRIIMHLDMDAFFASVEQADNPELRGKPVIIGGRERGVVSAASYEARVFGVRSAMPAATARRLCPQGVFLRGRMRRYSEISRRVMEILRERVPVLQQTSVDECYMDATGTGRLFGPPAGLALALKERVRSETGLTCSIGVAPNKFLAKVASDMDKPDGLFIIEPEGVPDFLRELPVEKIPGVGPRSVERLGILGVRFAADVLRYPREFWEERHGKWGLFLHDRALGRDDSPVRGEREGPKSSSAENTFARDVADRVELAKWILRHSERVGRDLRSQGLAGRTVTLKIRLADFSTRTRSKTLARPTSETQTIFETAAGLLEESSLPQRVRLIGVGVSGLFQGEEQLPLLPDETAERRRKLDSAMDEIRSRFGSGAVSRGRTFDPDTT